MYHDLPARWALRDPPLFQHRFMVSSPGARILFITPPLACSNDRLQSYVRPYAHCEYDNGYLVFDNQSNSKEVWRLASDFTAEDEVAAHAPPIGQQMEASNSAATMYHQYAPRGQFRPWALLAYPQLTRAYRLSYPTLICASSR